jgi:poly-gamma-glutamate capsule biosynthesis protein CapA/YwtB (metallophosphatase superfamily)
MSTRRSHRTCLSIGLRGLSLLAALSIATTVTLQAPAGQRERGSVSMVFAGDVMLDDNPGHAVCHGQDPFADVATALKADVTVCNLECVVARHGTQVLKPYTFKARPSCIPILHKYFSAVCVANNHSGDFGPDGLAEELELLKQAGLPYFGGGRDKIEARRPAILERSGRRIALLGYNDFPPRKFEAGRHRAGCAWLREADVVADIRAARSVHHADLVVPMLHWGVEIEPAPEESQRTLARRLIDAGADAIIGGHPHVVQTVEIYKGRPIVYSLGNFVFDYFPGDPLVWQGWVVRLTFPKSGPTDLEVFVVELDRTGFPHLKKSEP